MKIEEVLEKILHRLDSLDAGQKAIRADIKTSAEDTAGYFHETWKKMDKQDERITVIEDHLELKHPPKN